jgi:predicted alpha/beta-fold hydrolase
MATRFLKLIMAGMFIGGLCLVCTAMGEDNSRAEIVPASYEKMESQFSTCPNALYETIRGYMNVKAPSISNQHSMKLSVPGFCDDVPVKAVIQDHPAPLAVVLLGIGGSTSSDFSSLWPGWLANAGFNVLYFDSTFRPSMSDLINRGPGGNLWSEAEAVRDIISAYLAKEGGNVTKIGLVGMSYGGVEALILGQMQAEGKLPFHFDSIQAYSPPIDMKKTAAILDDWFIRYRWCYKLTELSWQIKGYDFHQDECANTLSDSIMKAAISASFHEDLTRVVKREDGHYGLGLLHGGNEYDDSYMRELYAGKWGFEDYIYKMALPYWRCQIGEDKVDSLIDNTRLYNLLPHQPAVSETIIAENDPFDEPEDMAALKNMTMPAGRLTLIPQGGHLGYVGDEWTKDKLLSLFAAPPYEAPRK